MFVFDFEKDKDLIEKEFELPLSVDNETRTMQYIRMKAISKLDQYPTRMEEDTRILLEQELTEN
jgi:hypothetical protein